MSAITTKKEHQPTEKVWWVVCDEYSTGPFTRPTAERKMAAIEAAGFCSGRHEILPRPGGTGRRW